MIIGIARFLSRIFIFTSLMALVGIVLSATWFQHIWQQPSLSSQSRMIIVPKGMNHTQMARYLHQEGLLSDVWLYSALRFGYALIEQNSFTLKAGEFEIPSGSSYADLFRIIDEGIPYQHRLSVIEGVRARDVVAALRQDERLTGAILRVPAEGTLAPDTYFFERGTERRHLIERMQERQELILAEEWANRAPDLPYKSPDEAVIMASIIEKESGLAKEQPLVASVFINRLNEDMRLQSDASVLYGIVQNEGRPREVLTRDLKKDGPWNTYRRDGYPRTAIANPSRIAIQAALNPMPSAYFYFVADGQGGHKFAKTYKEHQKNVKAYRAQKTKK